MNASIPLARKVIVCRGLRPRILFTTPEYNRQHAFGESVDHGLLGIRRQGLELLVRLLWFTEQLAKLLYFVPRLLLG